MNDLDHLLKDLENAPEWRARQEAKEQKRRDTQDERDAGCYTNGMDQFYDEYGDPIEDIVIPYWAKNLHKAHTASSGMRSFNRVDNPYRTVKKLKKPRRRDQMITLLEEAGFEVEQEKYSWTVFDNKGGSWELCSNGKVMVGGQVTATYLFIQNHSNNLPTTPSQTCV